jgi:hypothetical protein
MSDGIAVVAKTYWQAHRAIDSAILTWSSEGSSFSSGALALVTGQWLARHYGLPRLDLYYLAGGIPVLWTIGQLAAWRPAWGAASVSPAVARRNV